MEYDTDSILALIPSSKNLIMKYASNWEWVSHKKSQTHTYTQPSCVEWAETNGLPLVFDIYESLHVASIIRYVVWSVLLSWLQVCTIDASEYHVCREKKSRKRILCRIGNHKGERREKTINFVMNTDIQTTNWEPIWTQCQAGRQADTHKHSYAASSKFN